MRAHPLPLTHSPSQENSVYMLPPPGVFWETPLLRKALSCWYSPHCWINHCSCRCPPRIRTDMDKIHACRMEYILENIKITEDEMTTLPLRGGTLWLCPPMCLAHVCSCQAECILYVYFSFKIAALLSFVIKCPLKWLRNIK